MPTLIVPRLPLFISLYPDSILLSLFYASLMDSLALFFTLSLLLVFGLYWFIYIFGAAEIKGKHASQLSGGSISPENIQASYKQYRSFFKKPKQIETSEQVPAFVDTFYSLVTDIYEWGWGQSFHFAPSAPGRSHREDSRLYEINAVNHLNVKQGDKILDVGCGVGGPMRTIAAHSGAQVVGININKYQVERARVHNKKAGLDKQCEVVCGNFLEMPFADNSFDGAYSIEATCHAPKLEDVYGEIYRVLKPGAKYFSYEWVTTDLYKAEDPLHVEIIHEIERCNALPGLRSYKDIAEVAKKVGFEVLEEDDLGKPPRGPWWLRLKMGRIAHWRNRIMVTVLARLRILPRGVLDVHEMLFDTVHHLIRGGQSGIFTPMHMIACKKPVKSAADGW